MYSYPDFSSCRRLRLPIISYKWTHRTWIIEYIPNGSRFHGPRINRRFCKSGTNWAAKWKVLFHFILCRTIECCPFKRRKNGFGHIYIFKRGSVPYHHEDFIISPISQEHKPLLNTTRLMASIFPKFRRSSHSTLSLPPIISSSTSHPDSPYLGSLPEPTPVGVTISLNQNLVNAWDSSWRTMTVMINLYSSTGRRLGTRGMAAYKDIKPKLVSLKSSVALTADSADTTMLDKMSITLGAPSPFSTHPHVKLLADIWALNELNMGQFEKTYSWKSWSVGLAQVSRTSWGKARKNFSAIEMYTDRVDLEWSKWLRISTKSETKLFARRSLTAPLSRRNSGVEGPSRNLR